MNAHDLRRHPDAARLEYRSSPEDDTACDHSRECEGCGELFEGDADECEECIAEASATYHREHDHGAER